MQLWLLGGGVLGAVVGYVSQEKKNKNMGAVAGAGIGALAGLALKWQLEGSRIARQAVAPYAAEGAARVGAAASAAGSALATPSYQQLPAKTVSVTPATVNPKAGMAIDEPTQDVFGVTGASIEALLDEAGLPEEDMLDLMPNPFMS